MIAPDPQLLALCELLDVELTPEYLAHIGDLVAEDDARIEAERLEAVAARARVAAEEKEAALNRRSRARCAALYFSSNSIE